MVAYTSSKTRDRQREARPRASAPTSSEREARQVNEDEIAAQVIQNLRQAPIQQQSGYQIPTIGSSAPLQTYDAKQITPPAPATSSGPRTVQGQEIMNASEAAEQEAQQQPQQPQQGGGGGLGGAALGAAVASPGVGEAISTLGTSGAGGAAEALQIGTGQVAGPATAGQTALIGAGDAIGTGVAIANSVDAAGNIISGSRGGKGAVEGATTLAGTGIGYAVGGPIGAGVGSVIGRTVGRGLASLSETLGLTNRKSTKDYQRERLEAAYKQAATEEDKAQVEYFAQKQQEGYAREEDNPEGILEITDDGYALHDGPLEGRKWDWEELKNTVIDGSEVSHYLGFIDAFPDWMSNYTAEERELIAEAAIDYDLLTSEKGDVYFAGDDKQAILDIAAQVKEGTYQPLRTDEQRYQDRQAYLQNLAATEGYESPVLGQSMEQAFYAQTLQKAVAAVDRAQFLGEPIPPEADRILSIEKQRRLEAGEDPASWNTNPPTPQEEELYYQKELQERGAAAQSGGGGGGGSPEEAAARNRRPRGPMPEPYQPEPAPVLPPPGPPPETIKSPTDYADAYLEIYAQNQPNVNPINRSY